jgi:hypothetical protein
MLNRTRELLEQYQAKFLNNTITDEELKSFSIGAIPPISNDFYFSPNTPVTESSYTAQDVMREFVTEIGNQLSPNQLHDLTTRILNATFQRDQPTIGSRSHLGKMFLSYELARNPQRGSEHFSVPPLAAQATAGAAPSTNPDSLSPETDLRFIFEDDQKYFANYLLTRAVDNDFIQAFKTQFLDHLKIRPIEGSEPRENEAWKVVNQAINQNSLGKLSRLFDALRLPSKDKKTLYEDIELVGGIENYMRPMLKELSSVVLNKDKTGLSQEVIDAIGRNNYENLIQGNNGEPLDPATRAAKEKEIATQVMASIITNYSQSILMKMFSPEQQTLNDALKELSNKMTELRTKIKEKNNNKDFDLLNLCVTSVPVTNEMEATERVRSATISVQNLDDKSLEELVREYRGYEAIKLGVDEYLNPINLEFMTKCMYPFENMAQNFQLQSLEQPLSTEKSPKTVGAEFNEMLTPETRDEKVKPINNTVARLMIQINGASEGLVKLYREGEDNSQVIAFEEQLQSLKSELEKPLTADSTDEEVTSRILALNRAKRSLTEGFALLSDRVNDWGITLKEQVGNAASELSSYRGSSANQAPIQAIDELNTALADLTIPDPKGPLALFEKLNAATTKFTNTVNEWTVEPPKPLMNLVLRVLRAIFTGKFSLTTEKEKAAETRFTQETEVKGKLNDLNISSFKEFKSKYKVYRVNEEKPTNTTENDTGPSISST